MAVQGFSQLLQRFQHFYKIFESFLPFISELSDLQYHEGSIMEMAMMHNRFSEKFKTESEEDEKFMEGLEINDADEDDDSPFVASFKLEKAKLQNENEVMKKLLDERREVLDHFQQQIDLKKEQLRKGLFTAGLSVGGKCVICQEDIEEGRKVRRLDCDDRHIFCQVCIQGWLRNNNTCPICRHKFE